jgi:hypothetical protein
MISELLWQCCIFVHVFLHDFGTVLTVLYCSKWLRSCSDSVVLFYLISKLFYTTLSEQFRNHVEKHTENTTMSEQFRNHVQKYPTVRTVQKSIRKTFRKIVLYFSTCFSTWFRNCSDSVIFFYIISELLWHCGIFLHVFLHDFGTALTVLYFSKILHWQNISEIM